MFKGKVYVYRNNNGKEEELEKEFDNPQEFNNFRNTYTQSKHDGPYLGLGDWANLQNFFNDLIDRRFGLGYANEDSYEENEENECLPGGVDLDAYEKELQKIEYNKNHKAEEIQKIKDTLSKLKDYRKKFKDEGRDDMIEKIDKDIENMKKKLDELEK